MIPEWALEYLLEALVALTIWGLAVSFPFRRMVANNEIGLDILAVAAVAVFTLVSANGLFYAFDSLAESADRWYELIEPWSTQSLLVAYILFADFTTYWAHRLLHSKPLWHTHAFHHSPSHLYVLSGTRASFLHILVLFAGPVLALVLFPIYESPLAALLGALAQIINQHFIHSNLKVPFARYLEYVIVTPRFHFVHHSVNRRFSDRNFGFLFSVWDRLFGTYVNPEAVGEDEPLGLSYENSKLRLFLGLAPRRQSHPSPVPDET